MIPDTFCPSSVPAFTSALNRSPVDK